jgi:hypothetical protein
MKRFTMIMMAMVAIATAAFAQSKIYVYRNAGNTVIIPDSTIQGMECSKVDSQMVTHTNYVMQIIKTASGDVKIPLSEIDSISFVNPIKQAVNLGLSVCWASYNVGATKPEEFGGYYGWADPTGTKTSTNPSDYPSANPPSNISGTEYDIARAKWGDTWRLPTYKECKELADSCTWTLTTQNGVSGYKVVGPNGNSIFLPKAGQRYGTDFKYVGEFGYIWSDTIDTGMDNFAFSLSFGILGSFDIHNVFDNNTYLGMSVRPVILISAVTDSASNIAQTSVKLTGTVKCTMAHSTISCGMFYSTQSAGVKSGTKIASNSSGDGTFSVSLIGLIGNTTYYYCTYLMIDSTYYYGEVKSFTTKDYEKAGEAVDLGLSVKWASCNVGATTPEEYGGYYGWADPTGTKTSKNLDDYPSANPPSEISGTEYDIARAKWGGDWRLPTKVEQRELIDKCTWTWTTQNGVNGMKVTGTNGNSIFLPAAGERIGTVIDQVGTVGDYWGGDYYEAATIYATDLNLISSWHGLYAHPRCNGYSVRPVEK